MSSIDSIGAAAPRDILTVEVKKPKPPPMIKGEPSIAPQNVIEPTWGDLVDIINPLQQLPVVGDIYRAVTGEKISGVSRVLGGFLFGGITGGFIAAATAAYAEVNDKSPGEQIVAMIMGTDDELAAPDAAAPTMLADAAPTPQAAPRTAVEAAPEKALLARAEPATLQAAQNLGAEMDRAAEPGVIAAKNGAIKMPDTALAAPLTMADLAPLRDRLNHKKPTALNSDAKPLGSYMPAGAGASLPGFSGGMGAANLDMLQGMSGSVMSHAASSPAVTRPAERVVASGTVAPSAPAPGGNPLPAQLVQDMMVQALNKYQAMPRRATANGEGGAVAE